MLCIVGFSFARSNYFYLSTGVHTKSFLLLASRHVLPIFPFAKTGEPCIFILTDWFHGATALLDLCPTTTATLSFSGFGMARDHCRIRTWDTLLCRFYLFYSCLTWNYLSTSCFSPYFRTSPHCFHCLLFSHSATHCSLRCSAFIQLFFVIFSLFLLVWRISSCRISFSKHRLCFNCWDSKFIYLFCSLLNCICFGFNRRISPNFKIYVCEGSEVTFCLYILFLQDYHTDNRFFYYNVSVFMDFTSSKQMVTSR